MVCYWEKRGLTWRMGAGSGEYRKKGNWDKQERKLGEKDILTTASLSGGGCPGCPGVSTFGTASS